MKEGMREGKEDQGSGKALVLSSSFVLFPTPDKKLPAVTGYSMGARASGGLSLISKSLPARRDMEGHGPYLSINAGCEPHRAHFLTTTEVSTG